MNQLQKESLSITFQVCLAFKSCGLSVGSLADRYARHLKGVGKFPLGMSSRYMKGIICKSNVSLVLVLEQNDNNSSLYTSVRNLHHFNAGFFGAISGKET